jgi:hypothetical protein
VYIAGIDANRMSGLIIINGNHGYFIVTVPTGLPPLHPVFKRTVWQQIPGETATCDPGYCSCFKNFMHNLPSNSAVSGRNNPAPEIWMSGL